MALGLYELINNINKQIKSICCKIENLTPGGGGGSEPTYKVYTALLTQSGTDAPVITQVLENTTGATLSIGRNNAGIYIGTFSSNILTTNKTILNIQTHSIFLTGQTAINRILYSTISPNSQFDITTSNTSYVPTEATFALPNTFWIEIRVYN